ncbi:hypothetical protein [Paenibacillus dendritiformis]|uniref:hypothetical protein n=1 Tax=Paenibacillus dendritiformis TaxID=130049 RepID=UPI000DA6EF63|nr:hypothetical protein [Paenibacillus dendritiformis]PZM64825.1 hypothetical protein DOE73_14800 [Paenibacillus dendritiformis]
MKKKITIGLSVFVLLSVGVYIFGSEDSPQTSNQVQTAGNEPSKKQEVPPVEQSETKPEIEVVNQQPEGSEDSLGKELPIITDEIKEFALSIITGYDAVKDAHIEVATEKTQIILALQVDASTSKDVAKELGDNFARALASGAAILGERDLKSPTKDNLGNLYDYYDLQIGVGTGNDSKFIARGAKVTDSPKITW